MGRKHGPKARGAKTPREARSSASASAGAHNRSAEPGGSNGPSHRQPRDPNHPPPGVFRRREAPINRNAGPTPPHAWHLRQQAHSIAILRIIDTDQTGRHYEPKYAIKVLSKEEVTNLSKAGGLIPYIEEELGPGTYRCEWIGPDCYVLDQQVVQIDDVTRIQREHSRRRRADQRAQRIETRRHEVQAALQKRTHDWACAVLAHPALWAPFMDPLEARHRTIALPECVGPDLLRLPNSQVQWIIEGGLTPG